MLTFDDLCVIMETCLCLSCNRRELEAMEGELLYLHYDWCATLKTAH